LLRRFTEDERKLILENWPNTKLRKELSEKMGRTISSCNFEYYRLLKKMGVTSAQYKAEYFNKNKDFVAKLPEAPQSSPTIEERLERLEKQNVIAQLEDVLFLLKQKGPTNVSALIEENTKLSNEVQALRKQLLEEKERHDRTYKELDRLLNQFFGLTSIEKLASLKDFLPRIKMIVDKYGTVIGFAQEGEIHPQLKASCN
jgi:hypothetical protein